jgi:DNA modification methylase
VLPNQQQILFPLLKTLEDAGGEASPKAVYDDLARRVGLSDDEREATVPNGAEGRPINAWERRVRNARQQAVARGLVENGEGRRFNVWALTESALRSLRNARPGVCVVIYTTAYGQSVWGECQSAVGLFDDDSVDLIVTSPPYPLQRQKQYGNRDELAHVDFLTECFAAYKPKMRESGSLIVNLGDAWLKGRPAMSLYQERLILRLCDELGFHLIQRLVWENPSKMPAPAEWVCVQRIRVTPSTENVWWLSKTEWPKAHNDTVLRPYSESMRRRLAQGGEGKDRVKPSGHALKAGAFGDDRGGSIPHNLIIAANSSSNDDYQRACRAAGLPVHPARFPSAVADFSILLTTDPGDHVVDIFGGSNTTGRRAERLGRRWTAIEKSLAYGCGGMLRFDPEELSGFDRDLFAAAA